MTSNAPTNGSPGATAPGGAAGGAGGAKAPSNNCGASLGCDCNAATYEGRPGANGTNGANGTPGAPGSAGVAGIWWQPGGQGGTGAQGQHGGGGGGGGGGAGQENLICGWRGTGAGGGGGGGGGQGGFGGTGGWGGGSSYGIYLYDNGTGGQVVDCNITTGSAGAGGVGGTGGAGGSGGTGGLRVDQPCHFSFPCNASNDCDIGNGGRGGNGGAGGNGGNGGNGQPGEAFAVRLASGSALATSITNFNFSAQPIITVADISCTGTNVNFATGDGTLITGTLGQVQRRLPLLTPPQMSSTAPPAEKPSPTTAILIPTSGISSSPMPPLRLQLRPRASA
jgi:hypothetical protein